MSTTEQPGESPQLTRKQLREIRMTGATPIIGPNTVVPAPAPAPVEAEAKPDVEADAKPVEAETKPDVEADAGVERAPEPVSARLARPSEPVIVPASPVPDASVDLGVSPLTRRQARQQEMIRTASVPVITPDMMAAHVAAATRESGSDVDQQAEPAQDVVDAAPEELIEVAPATEPAGHDHAEYVEAEHVEEHVEDEHADVEHIVEALAAPDADRPVLRPGFGSELLAGADPVALPPSFDQLIARNATSTGSQSTSNALILSQSPSQSPITGPVTATGEVLITGSMALPEGLGSTGHAPGTADGKEADAVLIDREIPASSSPTPIAASAAISTVKGAQEIIRPPAPEKGSRLMLTLAITAGALALALVGVLILAFVTGVF